MWVDSTQTLIFDTKDELDMKYYFTNRDRLLSEGWKEECFTTTGIIFVKHGLPVKFDLKENIPEWSGDFTRYYVGEWVKYKGVTYKTLVDHVSSESLTPDVCPTFFEEVKEWN